MIVNPPTNTFAYPVASATMPLPPMGWEISAPISGACKIKMKKQEGKIPMNKATFNTAVNVAAPETNIEATQRDFVMKRIMDVKRTHYLNLEDQFRLHCQKAPRTAKELIEAIKSDAFSIDEKRLAKTGEEDLYYYNNQYGIIWGKEVPDLDGFKKARQVLDDAAQAAVDAATLSAVADLAKVLKDFQDWTYTA